MANELTWTKIHTERESLLADLENLTDEQWRTQSLCAKWTVQQVVAHMVGTATSSTAGFLKGMVETRGNLDALMQRAVNHYGSGSPQETLAAFRRTMYSHAGPPVPVQSILCEVVVHGEDIRRPMGLKRDYPADTLRAVADFAKNSRLGLGARKRIEGLHLMATDLEWSHGKGEIVEGPLIALIMAMTGRPAFLEDLSGDGLAAFASRVKEH